MTRALVLIDIQLDYLPGGAYPLVGPEAAAAVAGRVLAAFREAGEPVIHVRHVATGAGATFLLPGTPGLAFHPAVAPRDGEPVVEKHAPNSFLGTDLAELLAAVGADELVVVGMMSSMCVDSTARAAAERGFAVTVVHDACAAPDLAFGGTVVPGAAVHASFMAALDGSFATVVAARDLPAA